MFQTNIPPGKLVQVTTKGDKKRLDIAPSLTFRGILAEVTERYIELAYHGNKVIQNANGKVIGTEKGEKVQRIYRSTIDSVVQVSW